MSKLGTEENPIKLVPDNAKRRAFEDATGIGSNVDVVVDMSRMKPPKKASELYLTNLIRNPKLSADEIRLGFLLFDLLDFSFDSQCFLLVEASKFHMSKVGEYGFLYFHGSRNSIDGSDFLEKRSLLEIARKCRLDVNSAGLIDLLNRLHSFFYITCTEICEQNLAVNRTSFRYSEQEVLLSESSKMVHIRLNERFIRIDLTKRWQK